MRLYLIYEAGSDNIMNFVYKRYAKSGEEALREYSKNKGCSIEFIWKQRLKIDNEHRTTVTSAVLKQWPWKVSAFAQILKRKGETSGK